jgi:hypothetical protein
MILNVTFAFAMWPYGDNLDGNQRSSPTFTPLLMYADDHAAWNSRQLVQLPGPNGRDQGVDHHRQLVFGRDHDASLALLELNRLGAKLDGHHHLSSWVGLPPRRSKGSYRVIYLNAD